MAAALQAVINSPQSDRLKEALKIAHGFLIPILLQLLMMPMIVQRRLVEFMLAAFHRSPHFVALLKKPIVNRLGEAYDNQRLSWHYNFVGLSGSMEVVVEHTKMQLVNFLRAWNYSCMKTFLQVAWDYVKLPTVLEVLDLVLKNLLSRGSSVLW